VQTLDHRSRQRRCCTSLPFWGRCRGASVYPGLESLFSVATVDLSHFSCYSDLFYKGSSYHLISFGRCGFIYKTRENKKNSAWPNTCATIHACARSGFLNMQTDFLHLGSHRLCLTRSGPAVSAFPATQSERISVLFVLSSSVMTCYFLPSMLRRSRVSSPFMPTHHKPLLGYSSIEQLNQFE
jgi:hypothetical protein